MLDLDLENNLVVSSDALLAGEFGRLRSVDMGSDGYLYMLTSNQDGRGEPEQNDDRILRITPLESNVEKGDSSLSPLKQLQSGILPQNVSCKEGLELFFKINSFRPVCVKSESMAKLAERGYFSNSG
jgi:hypothetical protein